MENASQLSSARVRRRVGSRVMAKERRSSPKERKVIGEVIGEESEEEKPIEGVHRFKRVEILGEKVKKLDSGQG